MQYYYLSVWITISASVAPCLHFNCFETILPRNPHTSAWVHKSAPHTHTHMRRKKRIGKCLMQCLELKKGASRPLILGRELRRFSSTLSSLTLHLNSLAHCLMATHYVGRNCLIMFVDSTTQQKLLCVHQGDNYWKLPRNMEMWLCLCLWALWAARFTNYSCCGVVLVWEVSGDEELVQSAYQKRFCLFSSLLYLFLFVKSLFGIGVTRVAASPSQDGWNLFFFSFSTSASHLSQPKPLTAVHCGAFWLMCNCLEGKGNTQVRVPVYQVMNTWA